jgi:c-di-GMP-binding flagellar brake protein YcgR
MTGKESIERRRAPRYSTVGPVMLVNVQSGAHALVRLMDLSVTGCHVESGERFSAGQKVKVRINRSDAVFEAQGLVARSDPGAGAGIVFQEIDPRCEKAIQRWIVELNTKAPN